jgi:hypothetical protein
MSGSLTIGGMVAGLQSGSKIIAGPTMAGNTIIGTITDRELITGDNSFEVPKEAAAVLIVFPFVIEAGECKIRTNLDSADAGLPVPSSGFVAFPLLKTVTSIILHSSGSTGVVELSFI